MSVLRPSQQNDVDPLPLIADLLRTPTSWRWCRYAPLPPDRFPTRDPRTVASSVRRTQIRASRRHASPTGATRHASPRRDPGRPLCDPHEALWARPTAPPRRCTQPPIHASRGERSCSVSLKHPLFLRPLPANQLPSSPPAALGGASIGPHCGLRPPGGDPRCLTDDLLIQS